MLLPKPPATPTREILGWPFAETAAQSRIALPRARGARASLQLGPWTDGLRPRPLARAELGRALGTSLPAGRQEGEWPSDPR